VSSDHLAGRNVEVAGLSMMLTKIRNRLSTGDSRSAARPPVRA
jgi:hypothetical protein